VASFWRLGRGFWRVQMGIEEDEILPMLQVARPGDRRWDEMTPERVVLSSIRASRSTWKFLVCEGPQITETVWLSAARACVKNIHEECNQAGTHSKAERVVPGEAMQRHGATEGRIPCQGRKCTGDRTAREHDGETNTRGGFPATGCGDRDQRLGHGGEVPLRSCPERPCCRRRYSNNMSA
jgi:hypothetical protein